MSETQHQPGDAEPEQAAPGQDPATAPAAAPAPVARRSRRRLIVGLAVTALVLGAAGTGIGVTASRVATADRDPGEPRWQFPSRGHDAADTAGHRGVGSSLLPIPAGYEEGPDMDEFGSDKEFTGREATALRKKALRFLPLTERRAMEKELDRQRISSMAMRSYASQDMAGGGIVVTMSLSRMQGSGTARAISRSQSSAIGAIGIVRKGPVIKGYKDAHCYLPPDDSEEKLEAMFCSAYRGDVLVTFSAYGTKKNPYSKMDGQGLVASGEPAELLRAQLDRLGQVGESV
ncbi:hypothetical protein G3I40_38930 [Streptomyces sp. SID14478]|uniref:hypothetical protein n=1 Tax=Streptomyces sp. SID14478 TaxID=2706073 RepID=UPI0013E00F7E|nr:hypothetical protein [Streptomyces sp. SID14478]NEB81141.1 hypothetical protein [Streptomyces sp. SID14478]